MKKNTALLFLIRIIKLLVSILNLSLTAKYFGVSLEKDVWLLAISIILFLDMLVWGAVNETFRAKFIFLRNEVGVVKAIDKTKSLLFYTSVISFIIVCIILVFPQILSKIVAPSYTGIEQDKLINMIIVSAPILLITQLAAIGTSILNAYESFFIPEITGFITAVFNLGLLFFLAPYIGIYSLVLSYYAGAVILLILLIVQIKKIGIPLFQGYNKLDFDGFKVFFLFALPFFFPYFFGQISAILEKTLVSTLGIGYVSVLDYSRKFTDILTNVLSSVLVTMLVPVLSLKYAEKKPKEFVANFMQIFQLGILFLSFVITLFTTTSLPIVKLFFDKGKIPETMLQEISRLTVFYSWSAVAVYIYILFGLALLSSNRSKQYAFWGVIAQIVSILINVIFLKSAGIYIFPVSLFLSHFTTGIIMSTKFPYKSIFLLKSFVKYILVLISTLVSSLLIKAVIDVESNSLLEIIINSVVIMFMILVFILLFDLEEKKIIYAYYKKLEKKCCDF